MRQTLRTFVAVEITPDIGTRTAKLIAALARTPAKVKWVAPGNLHFTLKFLGEVNVVDVAEICGRITEQVADCPPFGVEVFGAGAFPTPDRPRTVWLGVGEGAEAMIDLHGRVEQALAPLGFRQEQRRFRPHLTIGRVRGSHEGIAELASLIDEHREFAGGRMMVTETVVFSSDLGRQGPSYEALGRAELEGDAPDFTEPGEV